MSTARWKRALALVGVVLLAATGAVASNMTPSAQSEATGEDAETPPAANPLGLVSADLESADALGDGAGDLNGATPSEASPSFAWYGPRARVEELGPGGFERRLESTGADGAASRDERVADLSKSGSARRSQNNGDLESARPSASPGRRERVPTLRLDYRR